MKSKLSLLIAIALVCGGGALIAPPSAQADSRYVDVDYRHSSRYDRHDRHDRGDDYRWHRSSRYYSSCDPYYYSDYYYYPKPSYSYRVYRAPSHFAHRFHRSHYW